MLKSTSKFLNANIFHAFLLLNRTNNKNCNACNAVLLVNFNIQPKNINWWNYKLFFFFVKIAMCKIMKNIIIMSFISSLCWIIIDKILNFKVEAPYFRYPIYFYNFRWIFKIQILISTKFFNFLMSIHFCHTRSRKFTFLI